MKTNPYYAGLILAFAATLCSAQPDAGESNDFDKRHDERVIVRSVERTRTDQKEVSWLGVAVEEASDALQAQLGLKTGEGLVVTMVASNSPASTADLHKYDVLAEFEGQILVDPVQLRKLVQMHPEGDTVNLKVYRGGKKISVSAKLAMTTWDNAALGEDSSMGNLNFDLQSLNNLTRDYNVQLTPQLNKLEAEKKEMLKDVERAGMQQKKASEEARRAMDAARREMERAMKEHPDQMRALVSEDKDMTDLANHGVSLDTDTSIVIKKDLNSAKSIVTTDDTGVYIIVADPKRRLTARDRDGKELFDGDIETPEQQAKVPKEVWEKVKPMIDQLGTVKPDKPQTKTVADKSNS